MKKVISLLFAVMLLMLCVLPITASAAEMTDPNYIYFQVPTEGAAWNNFTMIYCHMWSKDGGDIYGWQEKNEMCEDLGNGYWRYDLSEITFDPEGEYSLIFSNENGLQTYDLNITSACRGDIAYCNGDTCVNPVDGEKTCAVARWQNNGDKVHPSITLDSNGVLLNVDEVDEEDVKTVWGSDEGVSVELPDAVVETEAPAEEETVDSSVDNADGINTNNATMWIIIVCAVVICAIVVVVIVLAKKNKKK